MNINTNRSYFLFLLPTLFFAYQFILRIWPALQMDNIMSKFMVDATSFGVLSSMYYFGYSGAQLPIAFLLEKFGPRIIVSGCAVLCGISALIFSTTDIWAIALISRFFIGIGSAVGFIGVSKVISTIFPAEKYTKMVGISFSIGLMGAIYGGKPISLMIETFGSSSVSYYIGITSIFIGLMILIFLKIGKPNNDTSEVVTLGNFKELVKSKLIWKLAIANLFMVGTLEGLADVWGINFFIKFYFIDKSDAAQLVSFIFVGMLFGGPILAYFSDKYGQLKTIIFSGISMALLLIIVIYMHVGYTSASIILFLVGIFCCYQVIVFSFGSSIVEKKLLGVTIAFLNCINMLGGSFFHTIVGRLMDYFWAGSLNTEGIKIYTLDEYQLSLTAIPLFALIGSILLITLLKSKYTR